MPEEHHRAAQPALGIGRERQFEICIGGARGASAVGLGRPYVWGLAVAGEQGVREVIRNLRADFDLTLGLSGHASVRDVSSESVTQAS